LVSHSSRKEYCAKLTAPYLFFDNPIMPYTIAHPAAALPFRNSRLVFSAVIVGSMAPDFEYFLRMEPAGRYGHNFPGILLFTVPLGLVVLWLYQRCARMAAMRLLPECMQRRLAPHVEFRFGGARRFALLALSMLVGALTHVGWDMFTHSQSWLVLHWPVMQREVRIWWLSSHPLCVCTAVHRISTIIGTAILAVYILYWMSRNEPTQKVESPLTEGVKLGVVAAMSALAMAGARYHAMHFEHRPNVTAFGVFVVSTVALFWWELVALGWWWQRRPS
jgi:membrane-bound metal-dependent hydrolase YbcI (DUF457 family)